MHRLSCIMLHFLQESVGFAHEKVWGDGDSGSVGTIPEEPPFLKRRKTNVFFQTGLEAGQDDGWSLRCSRWKIGWRVRWTGSFWYDNFDFYVFVGALGLQSNCRLRFFHLFLSVPAVGWEHIWQSWATPSLNILIYFTDFGRFYTMVLPLVICAEVQRSVKAQVLPPDTDSAPSSGAEAAVSVITKVTKVRYESIWLIMLLSQAVYVRMWSARSDYVHRKVINSPWCLCFLSLADTVRNAIMDSKGFGIWASALC